MELLRHYDFDKLESAAQSLCAAGMTQDEFVLSLAAYLKLNDNGQPMWMTVVDGFYRLSMEGDYPDERDYFINEAQRLTKMCNALM